MDTDAPKVHWEYLAGIFLLGGWKPVRRSENHILLRKRLKGKWRACIIPMLNELEFDTVMGIAELAMGKKYPR